MGTYEETEPLTLEEREARIRTNNQLTQTEHCQIQAI